MNRLPGIIIAIVLSAILIGAVAMTAAGSIKAREATLGTRKILCLGILQNTENPARDDTRVISLCAEVGITRGG